MGTVVLIIAGLFILYIWYSLRSKAIRVKTTFEQWEASFDKKYSNKANRPIPTTLAGVKYNDSQIIIRKFVKPGDQLMLLPDTKNRFGKTAIRVFTKNGWMLGLLPNKDWNDRIFKDLLNGKRWEATVIEKSDPSVEFNYYNVILELWEYVEENGVRREA